MPTNATTKTFMKADTSIVKIQIKFELENKKYLVHLLAKNQLNVFMF